MERRMNRVGSNPNKSSDRFEARMMPDVEPPKPDGGGYVDCRGDGQHKVYLSPWQNKVRNFGARNTKVRGGRGTGKSLVPRREYDGRDPRPAPYDGWVLWGQRQAGSIPARSPTC